MTPRMPRIVVEVGLGLASFPFLLALALADASASAQDNCTGAVVKLTPCIDFIDGDSPAPALSCCPAFADVLRAQPECLCALLNGQASSFGIKMNRTSALELPEKCGIQAPPASKCKSLADPPAKSSSPAPAAAPSEPPPSSSVPSKPSGSGGPSSSDGNSNKSTARSIFFLAAVFLLAIY
ncbi:non-specific lipid transfer protein GPI-anchored 5-like [Typha latifolia]|uniref:non-specific lipid transfer protein GPI-anchored 5-like n=1 Tax=Typha latifolia TaxID=4733 RepID=UPI003C2F0756